MKKFSFKHKPHKITIERIHPWIRIKVLATHGGIKVHKVVKRIKNKRRGRRDMSVAAARASYTRSLNPKRKIKP